MSHTDKRDMGTSKAATPYETNRPSDYYPFFSICIPQYNRTDFLIKACETFARQSFKDFEICISDDCSTDGKEDQLTAALRNLDVIFVYVRQHVNRRYDGNLRSAIALSKGKYVFLMGNDDGLSGPDALQTVRDEIVRHGEVAVAITNYLELSSNRVYRRVGKTEMLGGGQGLAASTFRNYSFLSGLVFHGESVRREATDAFDGTEMYQMYIGTRLIAAGGQLLTIDRICIDKDLQISGQLVDSYRCKPKSRGFPAQSLPMERLLELVAAGLGLRGSQSERERHIVNASTQLYRFTYPFWIVEYRRVQSWLYALGVFLRLRPNRIASSLQLSRLAFVRLWTVYLLMGIAALVIPIRIFDALRSRVYALAKRTGVRLRWARRH